MKTPKVIVCDLCHALIRTDKEKYVHVEDWKEEKMIKEMWCHVMCFNKAMNRELQEVEKQAKDMLARCGGIMDKFYGKPQEEFVIK